MLFRRFKLRVAEENKVHFNHLLYSAALNCNKLFSEMSNAASPAAKSEVETGVTSARKERIECAAEIPSSSSLSASCDPKEANLSKRALKAIKRAKQKERYKEMRQKNKPLTRNPNPGYDSFAETDYYFENGLRKVYPYFFEFSTYTKGRWLGKTVLDVFAKEFPFRTEAEHKEQIEKGQIRVNEEVVSLDYKLKNQDIISSRLHRHENSVVGTPFEVLDNNEDLIVINKPASIPVHPCGRYRYNSIIFILGKEYGLHNLRSFYRLDRMTSGVLIIPKNAKSTRKCMDAISKQAVQKEYVCRVIGEFPEGEVVVDQPLAVLSHRLGSMRVTPDGKPAKTTFQRLSFNGKTSVVKCIPHTGRTHQIRVHLQYVGHPILNDYLYNSSSFGPDKGKGGITDFNEQEMFERLKMEHNTGLWVADEDNPDFHKRIAELKKLKHSENPNSDNLYNKCEGESKNSESRTSGDLEVLGSDDLSKAELSDTEPESKKPKLNVEDNECSKNSGCDQESRTEKSEESGTKAHPYRPGFDWNKWFPDEDCPNCKVRFVDPEPRFLIMYLHALRYKGPDWDYETSLPEWAKEDWTDPEKAGGSR